MTLQTLSETHWNHSQLQRFLEKITNITVKSMSSVIMYSALFRCQMNVRATKRLSLHRSPNILVVHLKRFRLGFQGKVNKKIPFTIDLGLRPYMSESSDKVCITFSFTDHIFRKIRHYTGYMLSLCTWICSTLASLDTIFATFAARRINGGSTTIVE